MPKINCLGVHSTALHDICEDSEIAIVRKAFGQVNLRSPEQPWRPFTTCHCKQHRNRLTEHACKQSPPDFLGRTGKPLYFSPSFWRRDAALALPESWMHRLAMSKRIEQTTTQVRSCLEDEVQQISHRHRPMWSSPPHRESSASTRHPSLDYELATTFICNTASKCVFSI